MDTSVFQKIILEIQQQLETNSSIIVSICGGSCTRKTSLVGAYLVDYFKDNAILISQDQFQLQPYYIENFNPIYKWDHPNNFEINACYNTLTQLKNNRPVRIPNYAFKKEASITYKTITPSPILIFEGLYTNYQELQNLNDISIYVKSPWYARITRRVFRNTLDRYKGREASSIVESFCDSVTKAHLDFVKLQETQSDFIIETPLQFDNIIEYYNLKPIDDTVIKTHNFFSVACNNNTIFKINETTTKQLELLFFYNKKLYLKSNITSDLANTLKKIDWLAY